MSKLKGKVAVVTGGGDGIGLATGRLFVKEGAKVLLVDIKEDLLRYAVDSINSDAVSYIVADVSQPEQVQSYVKSAVERYGGIDIFVNNAGIMGASAPTAAYPIEDFNKVISVNLFGAWLGLKYVIPEMIRREGGSIVITSSVSGLMGVPKGSAYSASKHAVIGLMRTAALEYASKGIRVNTINPSAIETPLMRAAEESLAPGSPEIAKKGIAAQIPMKRYGTPEEVARLILFLASDESQYITGGIYTIDGGTTAG